MIAVNLEIDKVIELSLAAVRAEFPDSPEHQKASFNAIQATLMSIINDDVFIRELLVKSREAFPLPEDTTTP